jgi:peptide/nickel transport system ATP-binding protein
MTAPLIELKDLRVAAGRGDDSPEILRGVSFAIERGRRLGLVGESGCGKSMTALTIMRLLRRPVRVAGGEILLEGTDLLRLSEREMNRVRGRRVAMIYQDPMSALNPVHTIGRQIVEGIRLHTDLSRAQARERAVELLGDVGVPEPRRRLGAYPHEFSGGMRQRVVIAMALSAEPDLVIADEPTTALDVTTQARILDVLAGLVEQRGAAMMLITHDLGVAAGFCDDVQVMYAGRIVERAPVDTLYARPLHPYSEALLGAACDLDMELDASIPAIGGHPPLPGEGEGACSFHPRCPYGREICRTTRPPLRPVGGALAACHFAEERLGGATAALEEMHG